MRDAPISIDLCFGALANWTPPLHTPPLHTPPIDLCFGALANWSRPLQMPPLQMPLQMPRCPKRVRAEAPAVDGGRSPRHDEIGVEFGEAHDCGAIYPAWELRGQ